MQMIHRFVGKFSLGQVVATPGVMGSISEDDRVSALTRHHNGDWGELPEEDKVHNNKAISGGSRLLSAYTSQEGIRFWIITEWDRSVTTFLLPVEY
ncbi:hypothetical protein BSK52_26455 [Paenibacillus odorifer]|uniref:Type I restriction endonuclease subunit M n=2 Tax=Paenibacillus odorifer TaxID=189426 RepID=A0A1R0XKM8_9BACL|nr:hypothetical protein BSK52_26455 [Paenibacillus odorifer]